MYIDYRLTVNKTLSKETEDAKEEAEMSRDNAQVLLVYAIAATVFTVSTVFGVKGRLWATMCCTLWVECWDILG